jgi:hypothetical protein
MLPSFGSARLPPGLTLTLALIDLWEHKHTVMSNSGQPITRKKEEERRGKKEKKGVTRGRGDVDFGRR